MKKISLSILFFSPFIVHSCPTCVGKVTSATVPFFAEEFYQPGKKNSSITTNEYAKKELQKLIDSNKGKK